MLHQIIGLDAAMGLLYAPRELFVRLADVDFTGTGGVLKWLQRISAQRERSILHGAQ